MVPCLVNQHYKRTVHSSFLGEQVIREDPIEVMEGKA